MYVNKLNMSYFSLDLVLSLSVPAGSLLVAQQVMNTNLFIIYYLLPHGIWPH